MNSRTLPLLALLVSLAPAPAGATQFYELSVSMKLRYSNPDKALRMGSVSGKLQTSSDGAFSRLVLDDKIYPVTIKAFKLISDTGSFANNDHRPSVTIGLDQNAMRDILEASDLAWYRGKQMKAHVSDMIQAATRGPGNWELSGSYREYHGATMGESYDDTHDSIELSDPAYPAESLTLSVDFGKNVTIR